jgi:hypothetical protein
MYQKQKQKNYELYIFLKKKIEGKELSIFLISSCTKYKYKRLSQTSGYQIYI